MNDHIASHIKAVFFDHDDTLVSTFQAKSNAHKHVAKMFYKKDLSDEEIKLHWGKPLKELVCLLYGTDDADQAMAYTYAVHETFPKLLYPTTIPLLQKLRAAGKIIGIVTATTRFSFEQDLVLHQMPRDLVDYTQTSDETLFYKPDPRVFEPALAWLQDRAVRPEEVMYIGDGLHDMQAALGAKFTFLGVRTGLVTEDQFGQVQAKSIASIADLYQG